METTRTAYVERKMSIKTYKKIKLKMLLDDFGFKKKMSEEEIQHFNELTTENDIDRFSRTLLNKYLN